MKLSEALVLAKTKVEEVEQVRNLNLWGNGLTDIEVREELRWRSFSALTTRPFQIFNQ